MIVHCKKLPYDVYIGRGNCPNTGLEGVWGNPFIIGQDGTREEVVEKYASWIFSQPQILKNLYSLKGKVLGCWCGEKLCHGEVLEDLLISPKLAIIGSRSFSDEKRLFKVIEAIKTGFISAKFQKKAIIISGGANGADSLGAKFARENSLRLVEFPAHWKNLGKSAGFQRNEDIIINSDIVLAAWDGESKGTAHSLFLAKKHKKSTYVMYF